MFSHGQREQPLDRYFIKIGFGDNVISLPQKRKKLIICDRLLKLAIVIMKSTVVLISSVLVLSFLLTIAGTNAKSDHRGPQSDVCPKMCTCDMVDSLKRADCRYFGQNFSFNLNAMGNVTKFNFSK